MIQNLLISLFILVLVGVPQISTGQAGGPDPLQSVKTGSSKALHDLLATTNKSREWAELCQDYILPNPFLGDPNHDLDVWYRDRSALDFRPEAGAFLYTPSDSSFPPPTLCPAETPCSPDTASSMGISTGLDPGAYRQWLTYCPPIECARIHRLLDYSSPPPDSLEVLFDILSRWDPGQKTFSRIHQIAPKSSIPTQTIQTWKDRILFSNPSRSNQLTRQLPLPLDQLRSHIYQRHLSVHPFVYDEQVDYYGRVLSLSSVYHMPPWAPIYDLLKCQHPRALYYLAAHAYRLHLQGITPHEVDYIVLLRHLTGLDILAADLQAWLLHFYTASSEWMWSEQEQRFYYYPDMEDHRILVESWFRYLASSDPDIALTFYQQIIDADPAIVRQHSGSFRQLLTQWNPILPPASLPFPEITSTFRSVIRDREEPLRLPDHLKAAARSLKQNLPLSERIQLEDSLMQWSIPEQIAAWEALALEWVAFPEAEQSISRIVDELYRQLPLPEGSGHIRESYLRTAGIFLGPERGDAASRYMERLKQDWSEADANSWLIHSRDEDSRNAIRSMQKQQTMARFLSQPGQLQPEDIFQLPPPESIPEASWRELLDQAHAPPAQTRIIQYFRLHPREVQTGEILRVWPLWASTASPTHPSPEESFRNLLEYVTGLYDLGHPLEWWQDKWDRGNRSWPGMLRMIRADFFLEFKQGVLLSPIQVAFLLRQSGVPPTDPLWWQAAIRRWDDPTRATTLPFRDLDVQADLPFFLDLGISPSRIADMAPRFSLQSAEQTSAFVNTLLAAAPVVSEQAELANRLFVHAWYRDLLTRESAAEIRGQLIRVLSQSLNESLWLSAFEEAHTWAQIILCQSAGEADRWLDLMTDHLTDPALQSQVFQLLIRQVSFDQLRPLLRQLREWEPGIRDPLVDILLQAFALPQLNLDEASAYRKSLFSADETPIQDIYRAALASLSGRFVPPAAKEGHAEWVYALCSREYVRPLFGVHPAPRQFPVLPVLAWWIGEQYGPAVQMETLLEYRQTGDLFTLVRAAQLDAHPEMKSGVNSLFTLD